MNRTLHISSNTAQNTQSIGTEAPLAYRSTFRFTNRFPDDVLQSIFLQVLPHFQSPYPLLRVCRRWYQLVVSYPRLWAFMYIPFDSLHRPPGHICCRKPRNIKRVLQRVAAAPLYLIVDMPTIHQAQGRPNQYAAFLNLLDLLFEPNNDSTPMRIIRWKKLQWSMHGHSSPAFLRSAIFEGYHLPPAEMYITTIWDLQGDLKENAPACVRKITLNQFIRIAELTEGEVANWFGAAEDVNLLSDDNSDWAQGGRDMILLSSPKLKEFRTKGWNGPLSSERFLSSEITRIYIGSSVSHFHGSFPSLVHLSLNGASTLRSQSVKTSVHFPVLRTLEFWTGNLWLLLQVRAPLLETLEIRGQEGGFRQTDIEENRIFQELWTESEERKKEEGEEGQEKIQGRPILIPSRVLHLQRLRLSSTTLCRILHFSGKQITQLQIMSCYGTRDLAFYQSFSGTRTLCPNLKQLHVDIWSPPSETQIRPNFNAKVIKDWMRKIVEERAGDGIPLEQFKARLLDGVEQEIRPEHTPKTVDTVRHRLRRSLF